MKILSIFSGCGGLDLGFQQAGFETVLACDFDPKIKPTFSYNFPNVPLFWQGVEKLNLADIPAIDGLIGGPPCQSWSLGGSQKGISDPRGKLFYNYIHILQQLQPKFFLAENVRGILTPKHQPAREKIISLMEQAGYQVNFFLLNAFDYEVPQDRERVFFIGYRKDLQKTPSAPPISNYRKYLRDILLDLPTPKITTGASVDPDFQHETLIAKWSPHFYSRNRVRGYNEPSFTTITFIRAIPLHPQAPKMIKLSKDHWQFVKGKEELYRRFSIREYARIQTFPDDFKFIYQKLDLGYKMIGNAVPVKLAKAWAEHLKQDLF